MKRNFKLEIEFSVESEDGCNLEGVNTYSRDGRIKVFIHELFKHPEVLRVYYCGFCLDTIIDNTYEYWEKLAELVNYCGDFGPIFKEVAKNCPAHVEEYIQFIYSEDTEVEEDNLSREQGRRLIEESMLNLVLHQARFTLI